MDNSSAQYPAKQALSGIIRRDAVEDMGGAVKNFFNLDALQLEPGPFCCQIDFIAAGNGWLGESRTATKFSQHASSLKLLLETLECLIDGFVFFYSY